MDSQNFPHITGSIAKNLPEAASYWEYRPSEIMRGLAQEMYLQDKVVEAYDNIAEGRDNYLQAEAFVRKEGTQIGLMQGLTLELLPKEVGTLVTPVGEVIKKACEVVAQKFDFDWNPAALVTILSSADAAEWMPSRWGYYIPKSPYGKICLPFYLVQDFEELSRTTTHEFMHHVSASLSHNRISHWLSEGLSTYAEGMQSHQARIRFRSGESKWLDPAELDGSVGIDNREEKMLSKISDSYAQANLIVHYLVAIEKEKKLTQLLLSLGDESFLPNIEDELLMRSHTDGAIRRVYGVSERLLFENALDWIRRTPIPASNS